MYTWKEVWRMYMGVSRWFVAVKMFVEWPTSKGFERWQWTLVCMIGVKDVASDILLCGPVHSSYVPTNTIFFIYLAVNINLGFWLAGRCHMQALCFLYGACKFCMGQNLLLFSKHWGLIPYWCCKKGTVWDITQTVSVV